MPFQKLSPQAVIQAFGRDGIVHRPVMMRRLTLTGSTLRARSLVQKKAVADTLRDNVWSLLDAGTVKPLIYKTFPLTEARQSHELMESSGHLGKILLLTGK